MRGRPSQFRVIASRQESLVNGFPNLPLQPAELRGDSFWGMAVALAVIVFSFLALHRIAKQPEVEHVAAPGVYRCAQMWPHGRYGAHPLGAVSTEGTK